MYISIINISLCKLDKIFYITQTYRLYLDINTIK